MIPRDYINEWRERAPWNEDFQVEPGPAGPVMDRLRSTLDPWLGQAQWKQSQGRVTFGYRFLSEDVPAMRLRLKVEINTREHFAVLAVLSNICFSRRLAKRSYTTASMADSAKGWARMEETIVTHVEPGETLYELRLAEQKHGAAIARLPSLDAGRNLHATG